MKMIFLVDGDNNIGTGLQGIDMLSEQDSVLAQSPEATYVLKEAAKAVAERAKTDVVATRVDVQRVVDAQHAQVARERNSANVMLDGTYVISKASYDIDDHMVQASINTVADLFERNLGGLQEQARLLGGDALAAHETTIQVAGEILRRVRDEKGLIEDQPSLRFVLGWETDANDVDFHIRDGNRQHAFYKRPALDSGGNLYADVTTGYGPECFTIRGDASKRSGPYTLQANYYARGPMGYGMGKLEIIEHDGHGGLTFVERPFVVMQDHAFVDLGTVAR